MDNGGFLMIKVTKPIKCPICNLHIYTYSTNGSNKKLLFTCTKGHTTELDVVDYYKVLNNVNHKGS